MSLEMVAEVLDECKEGMQKAIEALKRDLGRVRTGRASLSLLGADGDRLVNACYANLYGLGTLLATRTGYVVAAAVDAAIGL